jgi:hypothetical protein
MIAVFLALSLCEKSKINLQLKKPNNRSRKLASASDVDGCYEAYLALVEEYEDVTVRRENEVLFEKKVKGIAPKTVEDLVEDFTEKCAATAAEGTACATNLAKLIVEEPAPADQIEFKTVCKINAPDNGGDSSGNSGLFSSRASGILMLLGLAISSIYFKS